MAAPGHSWSDRFRKTNRTRRRLRFCRCYHLHNCRPIQVQICIGGLLIVRSFRRHDKAVIGMDVSRFVDGMVSRSRAPSRLAPVRPWVIAMVLEWPRRSIIQQMRNGGLPSAARWVSDSSEFRHGVVPVHKGVVSPFSHAGSPLVSMLLSRCLALSRHRLWCSSS